MTILKKLTLMFTAAALAYSPVQLLGCAKDGGGDKYHCQGADVSSLQETSMGGSYDPTDFVDGSYPKLLIEIDYNTPLPPPQQVLDEFVRTVSQYRRDGQSKPATIEFVFQKFEGCLGDSNGVTKQHLSGVRDLFRDYVTGGDTVVWNVFYLNEKAQPSSNGFSNGNLLGARYHLSDAVIFKGHPSTQWHNQEATVWTHELGHVLTLVIDPSHNDGTGHCDEAGCVMESPLKSTTHSEFDANCERNLADLLDGRINFSTFSP